MTIVLKVYTHITNQQSRSKACLPCLSDPGRGQCIDQLSWKNSPAIEKLPREHIWNGAASDATISAGEMCQAPLQPFFDELKCNWGTN